MHANCDLKQAADDLAEQCQMFKESIHSEDETYAWYVAKLSELRTYLDKAQTALGQSI